MDKNYITPVTQTLEYKTELLMEASAVDSDSGLGFGGVDIEGLLEPEARNVWWDGYD